MQIVRVGNLLLLSVLLPVLTVAEQRYEDARASIVTILDEEGVSGKRRAYILEQSSRGDLWEAIDKWGRQTEVVIDLELKYGVVVEALNAEFGLLEIGVVSRERIREATRRTIATYLTSVTTRPSEGAGAYHEYFEPLLWHEARVAGSSGPPPGLRRYEYGKLKVDCSPVVAVVTFKGRDLGFCNSTFAIPAGEHVIYARQDGYIDCQGRVKILYRQLSHCPCELKRK